ncbi:hypothetical protein PR048_007265 [Dryococelus australis]|uniref:Uncharacterized protein n=1 Tax=Dryococelus australis TaxID=614101 RepID=A0ABQ9IDA7_9NEOP|nr:hypothetical protein PR048_007265 [Dryococelus australis]
MAREEEKVLSSALLIRVHLQATPQKSVEWDFNMGLIPGPLTHTHSAGVIKEVETIKEGEKFQEFHRGRTDAPETFLIPREELRTLPSWGGEYGAALEYKDGRNRISRENPVTSGIIQHRTVSGGLAKGLAPSFAYTRDDDAGMFPTRENMGVIRRESSEVRNGRGRGGVMVILLAFNTWTNRPGSILGGATPAIPHVGIVPDDATGRQVFSGVSHFPRPFIPGLLFTDLASRSTALKKVTILHFYTRILALRATHISSPTLFTLRSVIGEFSSRCVTAAPRKWGRGWWDEGATTICGYLQPLVATHDYFRLPMTTCDYLRQLATTSTTCDYLQLPTLPATTCDYLQQPATTRDYLRLLATTCNYRHYLRLLATTCDYLRQIRQLQLPAATRDYLRLLATTCDYPRLSATTCDYLRLLRELRLLATTCDYPRLSATTCDYLRLLRHLRLLATTCDYPRLSATTCDYLRLLRQLRLLATTCDYPRLSATTCDYLRLPESICDYLRLLATTCDYPRLSATTCDYLRLPETICNYLRLPATTSITSTTCNNLRLPETICDYLQQPATTRDYLRLLATTCDYPRLSATTCDYLRLPETICDYLRLPATTSTSSTTCNNLRLPETICDYLRLPATTSRTSTTCNNLRLPETICDYLRLPATTSTTSTTCNNLRLSETICDYLRLPATTSTTSTTCNNLRLPETICDYLRLPATTRDYLRLLATTCDYLRLPATTSTTSTTCNNLRLPETICDYLRLPATTRDYLRLLATTCNNLRLPETICDYLQQPAITRDYLRLLATTCDYFDNFDNLQQPATIRDYLRLLATTCDYFDNFDNLQQPATTRDYLRLLATTCDYPRLSATTCDYLRLRRQLRQLATTCGYPRLSATTCDYLRLPETICDYLRLLATTCDYPRLSATTCNNLRLPETICDYLRLPATTSTTSTTCNYLRLPETICDYFSSETDLLINFWCNRRTEGLPRRRHRGANPRHSCYKSATLPFSYRTGLRSSITHLKIARRRKLRVESALFVPVTRREREYGDFPKDCVFTISPQPRVGFQGHLHHDIRATGPAELSSPAMFTFLLFAVHSPRAITNSPREGGEACYSHGAAESVEVVVEEAGPSWAIQQQGALTVVLPHQGRQLQWTTRRRPGAQQCCHTPPPAHTTSPTKHTHTTGYKAAVTVNHCSAVKPRASIPASPAITTASIWREPICKGRSDPAATLSSLTPYKSACLLHEKVLAPVPRPPRSTGQENGVLQAAVPKGLPVAVTENRASCVWFWLDRRRRHTGDHDVTSSQRGNNSLSTGVPLQTFLHAPVAPATLGKPAVVHARNFTSRESCQIHLPVLPTTAQLLEHVARRQRVDFKRAHAQTLHPPPPLSITPPFSPRTQPSPPHRPSTPPPNHDITPHPPSPPPKIPETPHPPSSTLNILTCYMYSGLVVVEVGDTVTTPTTSFRAGGLAREI